MVPTNRPKIILMTLSPWSAPRIPIPRHLIRTPHFLPLHRNQSHINLHSTKQTDPQPASTATHVLRYPTRIILAPLAVCFQFRVPMIPPWNESSPVDGCPTRLTHLEILWPAPAETGTANVRCWQRNFAKKSWKRSQSSVDGFSSCNNKGKRTK